MSSIDDGIRHTRTSDGLQELVYPWETPADRLVVLNSLARSGGETSLVRGVVGAVLRPIGAYATDQQVLQALLDAVFALVQYKPDPASEMDFYQPVEVTLRPVPGNPVSPITGQPKGSGDCEDTATLYVAMVRAAGHLLGRPLDGHVEWLSQPGKPQNHVPAKAWGSDGVHLWAETTLPGSHIGEHPYDALARLGNAPRIEGTYYPVNSGTSGSLHDPVVQTMPDGARVFIDPVAFARGGHTQAVVAPRIGLPYYAQIIVNPSE